MLARLMSREIHADVKAGTSLVECLREIEGKGLSMGKGD
jgi:hypothetical protein